MADLKKVSAGARKSAFLRWIYGNLTCFSQEHMQTFGYLAAMLPVVDELYDNDEDKVKYLSTYRTFFNTEPQIGTMVVGLTVGLEEARANGEPLDDDTMAMLANAAEEGELRIRLVCKYDSYDITVPKANLAKISEIGDAGTKLK